MFDAALTGIMKMSQTQTNYWGEFALDIPVGILLVGAGLRHQGTHPLPLVFTLLGGLFLFSFIEYFFHRWIFHGSLRLMAMGHQAHHENPLGYSGLPFFLPALLLIGLAGLFVLLMPHRYAFLLAGAIACGYVTYGLSHFAIHHVRFRHPPVRRWAANHHIHHHHPTSNFGVTTPLWDLVFSTRFNRE